MLSRNKNKYGMNSVPEYERLLEEDDSDESSLLDTNSCSQHTFDGIEHIDTSLSQETKSQNPTFSNISIFNSPLLSLKKLLVIILNALNGVKNFVKLHFKILITISMLLLGFLYLPGPHQSVSFLPNFLS